MIKAYLAAIPSQYEGEDIEIRYSIYADEKLLCKETVLMEYKKPKIVSQFALITLLKKLGKDKDEEIVILVNDAALIEIIRETSTTKNEDVIKMARITKKRLTRFRDCVIKDVSCDRVELAKWNEACQS